MNLVPLAVIRQAPKTIPLGCMTVIPASMLPSARSKDGVTNHDIVTVTVAATTATVNDDDDDRNSKSNYNYNF